jgi:hypothetical protein
VYQLLTPVVFCASLFQSARPCRPAFWRAFERHLIAHRATYNWIRESSDGIAVTIRSLTTSPVNTAFGGSSQQTISLLSPCTHLMTAPLPGDRVFGCGHRPRQALRSSALKMHSLNLFVTGSSCVRQECRKSGSGRVSVVFAKGGQAAVTNVRGENVRGDGPDIPPDIPALIFRFVSFGEKPASHYLCGRIRAEPGNEQGSVSGINCRV